MTTFKENWVKHFSAREAFHVKAWICVLAIFKSLQLNEAVNESNFLELLLRLSTMCTLLILWSQIYIRSIHIDGKMRSCRASILGQSYAQSICRNYDWPA